MAPTRRTNGRRLRRDAAPPCSCRAGPATVGDREGACSASCLPPGGWLAQSAAAVLLLLRLGPPRRLRGRLQDRVPALFIPHLREAPRRQAGLCLEASRLRDVSRPVRPRKVAQGGG